MVHVPLLRFPLLLAVVLLLPGLPRTARVITVGQEFVVDGERVNPVEVGEEVQS